MPTATKNEEKLDTSSAVETDQADIVADEEIADGIEPAADPESDMPVHKYGEPDDEDDTAVAGKEKAEDKAEDADEDARDSKEEEEGAEGSAETTDDAAVEFDEALVEEAESYGLLAEDFSTPAALERTLERLQRALPAAPQKQADDAETLQDDQFSKFELKLDKEVLDEGLVTSFHNMNEHYHTQNQKLVAQIKSMQAHSANQAAEQFDAQFDGFIADLGPEWIPIFGEGKSSLMNHRSKPYKNREAVMEEMLGRIKKGSRLPLDVLSKRSAYTVFDEHREKVALTTARKKSGPKRRTIARASQRGKPAQVDSDTAEQFADRFMKERGFDG